MPKLKFSPVEVSGEGIPYLAVIREVRLQSINTCRRIWEIGQIKIQDSVATFDQLRYDMTASFTTSTAKA